MSKAPPKFPLRLDRMAPAPKKLVPDASARHGPPTGLGLDSAEPERELARGRVAHHAPTGSIQRRHAGSVA